MENSVDEPEDVLSDDAQSLISQNHLQTFVACIASLASEVSEERHKVSASDLVSLMQQHTAKAPEDAPKRSYGAMLFEKEIARQEAEIKAKPAPIY